MTNDMSPFNHKLREYRLSRGLSQEGLASAMIEAGYPHGVSRQVVSYLETQSERRPTPETFQALRVALGLSLAEAADLALVWAYADTL